MSGRPAGDSAEQRKAGDWLLQQISERLGVPLTSKRIPLDGGSYVELDGFSESPTVLCEIWAHIGPPKGAQKNKVMTDAMRLTFVRQRLGGDAKCVLVFADSDAAAPFQRGTWMAECLSHFGITVEVVSMPEPMRDRVLKAQARQYR